MFILSLIFNFAFRIMASKRRVNMTPKAGVTRDPKRKFGCGGSKPSAGRKYACGGRKKKCC